MTHNFTTWDLAATSVAFGLFPIFLLMPGYVLGSLLKILDFERRTMLAKAAISVSLSIAVVPIALYLGWLMVPARPWLFCAVCWVVFPVLLIRERRQWIRSGRSLSKPRVMVLAILAGWVIVGTLCLIDLEIGRRLYFAVNTYDYALRAAITAAIERTGVPPTNPFFYSGHGYVLRYHYFWYSVCGLVERFGGPLVTARIAMIAGTLWIGIGLVAVVTLYVHFFRRKRPENADRQMVVAVALLSVTGLDLVPLAITFLLSGRFHASSEWWNEPVLSWINSVLWQPHSIAALIACLTGFLVVWDAARHAVRRVQLSGAAVGGLAFASGLGLSLYVTFVFAIFVMIWMVILIYRGRRLQAQVVVLAGVVAVVLSIPYLCELFPAGSGGGPGKAPLELTIRSFAFAEALAGDLAPGKQWQVHLANALALPLNYFLEFGFFFVVAIKQWKKLRQQRGWSDEDACGVAMVATSLVLCTFLRSNTIANNDLGWRGMIVAQFMLLIWGTELWEDGIFPAGKRFGVVGAMVALGAAATVYDVTMLRIYPILLDQLAIPRYHWLAPDHALGERTYALRQVYEELKGELPKNAIVQQNPDAVPQDLFYGLYADRQTAAGTLSCGVVFGGSAALCPSLLKPIGDIFSSSAKLDSARVDEVCQALSIDALVVKDTDDIWKDRDSWTWRRPPLIANAYSRAFLCGTK